MSPFTFPAARTVIVAASLALAPAAFAQDASPGEADHILKLKECQGLGSDRERLACFDQAVGAIVGATEKGDLRLVDREDMRQTRRRLFGFALPRLGLFGDKNDADAEKEEQIDMLESTVTRVNHLSGSSFTFEISDGEAVWQVNDAPSRLRRPEPGQAVVFKKASLGSYFIRINGQLGVKGRRIR